jgi:enoyl-[acyl-carrier protein] reductase III
MEGTSLEGRTALITGGSRGIGAAVARQLAQLGADLVLGYRTDAEAARAVARELRSLGRRVEVVGADLRKRAEAEGLIAEVRQRSDRLDILVLNAAFGTLNHVETMGRASWKATFDLNVVAALHLVKGFAPMLRQSRGCVLALSSIGAQMPFPKYAAIGASKAALEALIRTLALELGRDGIRVNGLSAGPIDTRAVDRFPDAAVVKRWAADKAVLGRLGTVEDLAPVAAFLCTEAAGWITGQTLIADGGILCSVEAPRRPGSEA